MGVKGRLSRCFYVGVGARRRDHEAQEQQCHQMKRCWFDGNGDTDGSEDGCGSLVLVATGDGGTAVVVKFSNDMRRIRMGGR